MAVTGAFLGISVGSPYYSKQRILGYLAYAKITFDKFAFLIGDEIFKYTLAAMHGLSIAAATERALTIGQEREVMLTHLMNDNNFSSDIIHWHELSNMPLYSTLFGTVTNAYKTNSAFKAMVRRQVFLNLGDRVEEVGLSRDSHVDNDISFLFDSYIIEEVAGLISLSESTIYNIEVYPGRDLLILKNIYKDHYPELTAALPTIRKRIFKQIQIG